MGANGMARLMRSIEQAKVELAREEKFLRQHDALIELVRPVMENHPTKTVREALAELGLDDDGRPIQ